MSIQNFYEKYAGLSFSKHPEIYVNFTPAEGLIFGDFFNPRNEFPHLKLGPFGFPIFLFPNNFAMLFIDDFSMTP